MEPLKRKSKVAMKVRDALVAGQEVRSGDFSRTHGLSRQSVGLALQKLWERNDDVKRDKEGNAYVYYVVKDSAVEVAATVNETRARLRDEAELEASAWSVVWENGSRMLIEADGRMWWATPLG